MTWNAIAATSTPEPIELNKGLIFIRDTDVLLSGDQWTIVVNIALDDYTNLIELLKVMLDHIRQKIQAQKNPKSYSLDIYWDELNWLNKIVEELEGESQSFQKLLYREPLVRGQETTNARNKRGLFNILGYGLKYLFGTADARDVKQLSSVCDELHAFEAKVVHASEHQLTYVRALDEMTRQNIMDTVELARALRESVRNF